MEANQEQGEAGPSSAGGSEAGWNGGFGASARR